ncbi:hypothetical protein M409DRAFT_55963 [Zasmidium cellare ATCC 36951]|uniref:Uncharacterized protein n=1 Tax=Zasmidium cellare ATCC 36951 TaxID=1080233 RepID=A0A6A6CED7_ZASCE|nr:uncharacterized protein M409DRAFT_55963 [Zasmidium cellare ATCC 36951]KAF2165063.1 hypothetical protein M409DRAFT_55963 [Zasmidium cellare ATCC 36951]
MGLFVSDDGHYQGWLAALLCCWAALSEDEHPIEKKKISRPTTARNTIWNEQPTPLRPMPSTPSRTLTATTDKGIEAAFNDDDLVRPISERPPSIKPLDFGGESPLLGKMSLHARQKSSTTLPKRISISRPTDFRRLEYTEKQRRSLVPLQLSPVVLREHTPEPLSHDPTGNRLSRSADGLMEDTTNIRNSYRASRGTPFERCQQLSSTARLSEPAAGVNERGQIILDTKVNTPTRPPLSTQSSSSSMHSLRRQALESSSSASTTPSRPSSERIRLKRKRSNQKNSGGSAELNVDKEILELNTIVEERRAESTRPQSPTGDGHVPAVAPLMPVRARSETLTDIGSAFSRPLISVTTSMSQPEENTISPVEKTFSPVTPIKSRLSRPFVSMPDPSVDQTGRVPIRRPSSRVTGWLTSLLSSSSTPAPNTSNPTQEPFYTCAPPVRRRPVSEASLCTSNTDLESPAFTATSSPMSKSHSRSLTAESRMTPISPPSTVDENVEPGSAITKPDDPWPLVVEHPSQVGLAL